MLELSRNIRFRCLLILELISEWFHKYNKLKHLHISGEIFFTEVDKGNLENETVSLNLGQCNSTAR